MNEKTHNKTEIVWPTLHNGNYYHGPVRVVFHKNCLDGVAAAAAFHARFPEVSLDNYRPMGYDDEPPRDVEGVILVVLDFSFKRSVLEDLAEKAKFIVIIDHHKTAQQELEPPLPENVETVFDMDQSGAVLTWKYFHLFQPPKLLLIVQDRDLWRFELDHTKEICAALYQHLEEYGWRKTISEVSAFLVDNYGSPLPPTQGEMILNRLKNEGDILARVRHTQAMRVANGAEIRDYMFGEKGPVAIVNCPSWLVSEVGDLLGAENRFVACYYDIEGKRYFSLRSRGDGADVSKIARKMGGGGHKHAAGFVWGDVNIAYGWPE